MFGPKSTADTFYKWVRTGCHSLPPIFHTYSVWSGGVCHIGEINGRGYCFEIKWEKTSFRDFIFGFIIACNVPTRLFPEAEEELQLPKMILLLTPAELKSKPVSHCCSTGPVEHSVYPFLFSEVFHPPQNGLFQTAPNHQPICLSESSLLDVFLPSRSPHATPASPLLMPFWFLPPAPSTCPFTSLSLPDIRAAGMIWSSSSTTPRWMQPCPPMGQRCVWQHSWRRCKCIKLSFDQPEQGCSPTLSLGTCLPGGQDNSAIQPSNWGSGYLFIYLFILAWE